MVQIVLSSVLVFFIIVTIHEWGHFIFAKRAGILVREFAIGFGPKVFAYTKGETRYTLRLLPIGGYVRMAGEDPEVVDVQAGQTIAVRIVDGLVKKIYTDKLDMRRNVIRGEIVKIDLEHSLQITLSVDEEEHTYDVHPQAFIVARNQDIQIAPRDRQFGGKTVGQRALAIFGGPLMNFILAFILFAAHVLMVGVAIDNPTQVKVGAVKENMPAAMAKIQVGDIIEKINGVPIGGDSEKLIQMTAESEGKPMTWSVLRGTERFEVTMTPVKVEGMEGGKVGINPAPPPTRAPSFVETFEHAGKSMVDMTKLIFDGFGKLIFGQFKLDDLGGPVRTFEITGQVAKQGIEQLTLWTAVLSLYLGIFNLLPIPALDGSRLVFIGVEALRGKPIDPNRESMVHFVGFAMLMVLILVVTYNDILRLVKG